MKPLLLAGLIVVVMMAALNRAGPDARRIFAVDPR